MSHKFDFTKMAPDTEPKQVSENEKEGGVFRGLLRKLFGRSSSNDNNEPKPSADNNKTLNEAELVAKINDLKERRDELNQDLDRLWPVLSRYEDSAPAITREMKYASERAEDAKLELNKVCEQLRKINPNNPILLTQKFR